MISPGTARAIVDSIVLPPFTVMMGGSASGGAYQDLVDIRSAGVRRGGASWGQHRKRDLLVCQSKAPVYKIDHCDWA